MTCTLLESPISNYTPSLPSIGNSPNDAVVPNEARLTLLGAVTPTYDGRYLPSNTPLQNILGVGNGCDDEEVIEEEDPDNYSSAPPNAWRCDPSVPSTSKPAHRRSKSTNEVSLRNARRAHTVVERSMSPPLIFPHEHSLKPPNITSHSTLPFSSVHIANTSSIDYRDRLNDKIAELGLYLFDTSAESKQPLHPSLRLSHPTSIKVNFSNLPNNIT